MRKSFLFWLRAISLIVIGILTLSCSCSTLTTWFPWLRREVTPAAGTIGGPRAGTPVLWFDGATMRYIPGGDFDMGGGGDDAPVHDVSLPPYWMYETKVTKRMYARCVAAGVCTPPTDPEFGNTVFDDYPVVGVNHKQASAYCAWIGLRLPSEAEWELAARGPYNYTYPWGNEDPRCELGNFDNCKGHLTAVTAYPDGASYYGMLDMAGNAYEWVADWYSADYYALGPELNPLGPLTGTDRSVRGSAYYTPVENLASAVRSYAPPDYAGLDIGFRCAMSETGPTGAIYPPVCEVGSYVPDYTRPGLGDPTQGGGLAGPAPLRPLSGPSLSRVPTATTVPGTECVGVGQVSVGGWCEGVVGSGDYAGITVNVPPGTEGAGWTVTLPDGRQLKCAPVPGTTGVIACTGPLRQNTEYVLTICGPGGDCIPGTTGGGSPCPPGAYYDTAQQACYCRQGQYNPNTGQCEGGTTGDTPTPVPYAYPYLIPYSPFEFYPGIPIGRLPPNEPQCPPGYVLDEKTGACVYDPQTPESGDCPPLYTAVVAPGYNCAPVPNPNGDCPVGHYYDEQARACIPVGDPNRPCVYGLTATAAFPQNGCSVICPQGYTYDAQSLCCRPPQTGGDPGRDCPVAYTFAAANLTCLPGDQEYPQCPQGYYYSFEKETCLPRDNYPPCPDGAYYDPQRQTCMCKEGWYNPKLNRCEPIGQTPECPPDAVYDLRRQTCVCPEPGYMFDPRTFACVKIEQTDPVCPPEAKYDPERGTCICGRGYYDPKTNTCFVPPQCPDDAYYDTGRQTCICRQGQYNPQTGQCEGGTTPQCPQGAYYDAAYQTCVCREGKYNPQTGRCEGGTSTTGNCTTIRVYIPSCATPTPVPPTSICYGLNQDMCLRYQGKCYWDTGRKACLPVNP